MNTKIVSITSNKKAYFDYEVGETWEAGIKLLGYEVKAIKEGKVNLRGSYISPLNHELWLKGCHISPLGSLPNKQTLDTTYPRKILLPRKTINYLSGKILEAGKTILVLEIYLVGSLIKVKVGLGTGRKSYDKKQVLKERSMDKEALKKIKDLSY